MAKPITKTQRAALKREAKERIELFLGIGQFIFEFSQLEFTIRHTLGAVLELRNKTFDLVTSPYDFATLCRVTKNALLSLPGWAPSAADEISDIFSKCLSLNEDRVKIAHGTWTLGGGTRHVSRQTLKASSYFLRPTELIAKARDAGALMNRVVQILIGNPKEWPEISKRLLENDGL
jgi:hypothetical protein